MKTNILKKIVVICLFFALTAALTFTSWVAVQYGEIKKGDVSGTAVASTYVMDDDANFVANIPFQNYLTDSAVPSGKTVYKISDYGAVVGGDFAANRTAINNAIAAASEAGGGVVIVDGGDYPCANIKLLSDVTLKIEKGSSLTNITYQQEVGQNSGFDGDKRAFIQADNAKNIIIEGPGKICGQGATYCKQAEDSPTFLPLDTFNLKVFISEHRKRIMRGQEHEMIRYFLVGVNYCQNVQMKNIELYEAGSWTSRFEGVTDLLIEDVVVNNNVNVANTDGIDIMGGQNITIRHCYIATGDDGICLKTDPDNPPLQNVLIEGCEVMSLANCFKIGTATAEDIKGVTVKDCFFFMAGIAGGYAGLAIEATDGGEVSDVKISNIVMENVTAPLLIWLGYRGQGSVLKDVEITDVTATNCEIASAITGAVDGKTEYYVENVALKNFYVSYREAKEQLNVYKGDDAYGGSLNMSGYPEITRVSHKYLLNHDLSYYWDLPVYGLYARMTKNLTVSNFIVTPRSCNTRPLSNVSF